MTNEELLSVAEIVERLSARFHKQLADHEAKMAEHRAAFGARTEADAKIIAGLREELDRVRNSLGIIQAAKEANKVQVQDMRAEMERLSAQLGWERAEIKRLQWENATMHKDAEDGYAEAIKVLGDPIALSKERDALRAEVAALQERLRASIARGDFAQMEVAALMSQTSKPCDQPVTVEVGDMVQLVRVPTMEEYADWEDLFGGVGSLGIVKSLAHQVANVKYNDFTWEWPLSCIEVVTEATHDTEAGKAAAESAVKTDPVADEIKVGDLVEVFQASYPMTIIGDIGAGGIVVKIVPESAFECEHVQIDSNGKTRIPFAGMASIKDVRKVTTVEVVRTEPDDIKVGDLVEVVSNRGRNTWLADVGSLGTVTSVEEINESISVRLDDVPGKQNALAGYVSLCDVRKVTT